MNSNADIANEATTAVDAFQVAVAAHNIETQNKREQLITDFLAGLSEQEQLDLAEDDYSFDLAEALAHSEHKSVRAALVKSSYYGAIVTIANREDIPEDERTEALEVVTSAAVDDTADFVEDFDRVRNGNHGYSQWVLDAVEKLNA